VESRSQSFGEGTLALIAPTVAHSFSFADDSEGVVIVFTSDVVHGISDTRGTLGDRLAGAERAEIIALEEGQRERFSRMAHRLLDEFRAGKDGAQIAMLSHLALLIVEISRLGLEDERLRLAKPGALDDTVARLKQLVEDNFRHTRNLSAYAEWLAMTPDRLNEHCKKVTGVTAGHLIRQRLLVEAKRELVFTGQSVSEISYSLNFSDPSYFSRFFRKHSGQTPQQFRDGHR
jgi:AraC family transcriptional activator of pobA